jgi:hypothetical protein
MVKSNTYLDIESEGSNTASAKTELTIVMPGAPLAPSNLSAESASSSKINLQWEDKSNNESGFKIERSDDGAAFIVIKTLGANSTSYEDTGLDADTTYTYRVGSYKKVGPFDGSLSPSNTASATTEAESIEPLPTAPLAPVNLSADSLSTSKIILQWQDKSDNESGFKIERREGSATFTEIGNIGANATSYTNTGLEADTTYQYRVMAYNSMGNSAYTNTTSAKTKIMPVDGDTTIMKFYINSKDYSINDVDLTTDTSPIIRDGRTVLPIRFVAEPLDAEVAWDGKEKMVTITMGPKVIKLWIGNNTANVDGVDVLIDPDNPNVMPIIIPPGRTMLPIRFIAENLGCEVEWLAGPKEVKITYIKPSQN